MIEANQLCKVFNRFVKDEETKNKSKRLKTKKEEFFAVNNISFKAKKGEIYGILGPNGAGKTTLLRMLGGVLTPTSGNIKVAGFDYDKDRKNVKKKIGYLSGNTKLYGRITPRELFNIFGRLHMGSTS